MRVYPRRKRYNNNIIGDAPIRQGNSEFFVYHLFDKESQHEGYCGAFCEKGKDNRKLFFLPGAIRSDGLFTDPLEARNALNKYLEGLKE